MTAPRRISYQFAGFRLDAGEKDLFHGGQPVLLTPKAVETLLVLVERHGRLVTKDEIFRFVWPDAFVEDNNLAQNISTLRRALGDREPGRQFIETVPKRGYRFVEPVRELADDASVSAAVQSVADAAEGSAPGPSMAASTPSSPGRRAIHLGMLAALIAAISIALMIAASSRAGDAGSAAAAAEMPRPLPAGTADSEAYLAFLRGIAAYRGGFSDTTNQSLARTELEHAVARDPRFALAWSWLARTYTSQYRSGADRSIETRDAAYRAARKAIELDGALADAHLALSQALYGDREYAAARRELEIARVGLPNSVELWQLLGHVEQAQGRWRDARSAFMRAFELDPAATADWIAVHYLHMRDYSEARRFIGIARAANKAGSVVPDAWMRFSEGGDVAAARPVLEAALGARSPADARVRGLLARLEWFDGRYERALELIGGMDSAGAWMPANFRYPASLAAGELYETLGDRARARSSYEMAIAQLEAKRRQAPDDYQVEGALGLAAAGLGRHDEAVRHGRRAIELLPVSKDAVEGPLYLYLLARIHSRVGQQEEAIAVLDEMFLVPGFYNESWVRRDPGFAALRRHPSFIAHLERWSARKGDALLR